MFYFGENFSHFCIKILELRKRSYPLRTAALSFYDHFKTRSGASRQSSPPATHGPDHWDACRRQRGNNMPG